MKKFGIIVLFFIIILAFNCQMPIRKMKKTNEKSRLDERDGLLKSGIFDAPGLEAYVGKGYNLLDEGKPYKGTALNTDVTSDSVVFKYDGMTTYKYVLIEDNSDLIELDSLDAQGSVEGAYGVFSIEGSAKYAVENSLSISNKSISVLVIAKYNYGSVILDKTEFLGDYLTLLNENKEDFYQNFGNGYSHTTELGGYLFCLYTFSLKERAEMEYESLKASVEGRVAGLFSVQGGVDIESLKDFDEEHVEIRASLFAIGPPDYIPGIPTNNTEMSAEITAFKESMVSTFSNVNLNDPNSCMFLPCLGTKYESYEDLANRLDTINTYSCDIDEYYNKKMSWWRYYGKLDRVRKDLEANTFNLPVDVVEAYKNQIIAEIDDIDIQMGLCIERDTNAIYSEESNKIDVYNDLINIFKIKLESPDVFTVVDQDEVLRLSWNDDLGLTDFNLLVNSEIETDEPFSAHYYDYTPTNPGVTTWSVLGYSNNGIPVDSVQQSFIVPGFDLISTQVPNGPIEYGTTIRFYIVNQFPSANGMTNVLCVQKDSDPEQRIDLFDNTYYDYTFGEENAIYTVWVEGSCNGTTGKSTDLTINTNFNDPPVLDPIENKTVNESEELKFTISATDVDSNTLTYSTSEALPSGATLDADTGEFCWTNPKEGIYTINFEVSDGDKLVCQEVTITCLNIPPVLTSIGTKTAYETKKLEFTISGSDSEYDSLTYSASDLPYRATFTASTRKFSWTPSSSDSDTYYVTFTVTDGDASDSETVAIKCWETFTPQHVEEIWGYGAAYYIPAEQKASCGGAAYNYVGSGKVTFIMTGCKRYRAEFKIVVSNNRGSFQYPGGSIYTSKNSTSREWGSGNCYIYGGNGGGVDLTSLKFYRIPY